jgi:hypothetical protein
MDKEMLHMVRAVPTKTRKHGMFSAGHYAIVIYAKNHWSSLQLAARNERFQV